MPLSSAAGTAEQFAGVPRPLTRSVIERRNDYVQAWGRCRTMMDWERDDLVLNMGTPLGQCERDVRERMIWHFLLVRTSREWRPGRLP